MGDAALLAAKQDKAKGEGKGKDWALDLAMGTATTVIQQLPKQLEDLSALNQKCEAELAAAETELAKREERLKLMEVDAESYTALNNELTSAALRDRSSGEIAKRLVALSEELRSTKLQLVQSRRQLSTIRDEKRHAETLLATRDEKVGFPRQSWASNPPVRTPPPVHSKPPPRPSTPTSASALYSHPPPPLPPPPM